MTAVLLTATTMAVALNPPSMLAELVVAIRMEMIAKYFPHPVGRRSDRRYVTNSGTIARLLANILGHPIEEVTIDEAYAIDANEIKAHARKCGLSEQSAVQKVCDAEKLLDHARALGWRPAHPSLAEAWRDIVPVMKGDGSPGIVRLAIEKGVTPEQFSDATMADWKAYMYNQHCAYLTVKHGEDRFRHNIRAAGLQNRFPCFDASLRSAPECTLRRSETSESLQKELDEVLDWKLGKRKRGRDARCRIRKVTAKNIEGTLRHLCGFAVKVLNVAPLTSLTQVLTEECIDAYIKFEDKCKSSSITTRLSSLNALMNTHPLFAQCKKGWLLPKLKDLRRDDPQQLEDCKAAKYAPYTDLSRIPAMIRAEFDATEDLISKAWFVHDELLMSWWVAMPWRQRNIRECRIKDAAKNNLFFSELPEELRLSNDLPAWVTQALHENPRQKFWWYLFREEETKAGSRVNRPVRRVVPLDVVPLLTMWIDVYRPLLVRAGVTTLFINRRGRPMSDRTINDLLSNITVCYIQQRVTPHLLRDIYGYWHLSEKRGSLKQLAHDLFHFDLWSTATYTRRFNTSNGVVIFDERRSQAENQDKKLLAAARAFASSLEAKPFVSQMSW